MSAFEGSLIPNPRHYILVELIKTKEHEGCVHSVGDGIGLRVWFDTSRKSTRLVQKETIEYFDRKSESQKKYFEDTLAVEWKSRKKDMKELYVVVIP